MKNIFDYATKELTQDAFLRWLFENYEVEEIGKVAFALLKEFCGSSVDVGIKELHTTAQWHNIDISVWITLNDSRKIALFIEDKTFSCEHNQLSLYDKAIEKSENEYCDGINKIFYKTDLLDIYESERIEKVNKKNKENGKSTWRIYDINKIVDLFGSAVQYSNIILKQYVEHINGIKNALNNLSLPKTSNSQLDFIVWKVYFEKVVLSQIDIPDLRFNICIYRGQFTYLQILMIGKYGIPYLEIRSRDCCNNTFKARLLCYGIDDTPQNRKAQERILDKLNGSEKTLFETKGIRKMKKGISILPKQIGTSPKVENVNCSEEFISQVKKYAEYYVELMRLWID